MATKKNSKQLIQKTLDEVKTVVVYVRVSTEEQAKSGYSIDAQIQRCEDFARRHKISIIASFKEEGKSAKTLNRPELQKMLNYCKRYYKDIDAILFWKWDRLSRGEDADYVELGTLFARYGITPISVEENNDVSPEAKLMRKITRATSAYELDKDSQRTKLGLRRKAEEGYFPGKAPIGYLNKRDSQDRGYIVVDEILSPYVQRIFDYYSRLRCSLDALGDIMFAEGFKDKYGKPYRARKFEEILKNPFYIGKFLWNGELYDGKHKAIISKKLFYKVQEMFGKTNKPNVNGKKYTYSRFINCAKCGCVLTAETKCGGHNSGEYTYYHCTNRKKEHPNLKGLSVAESSLDSAFYDVLCNISIPDNVIKLLKNKVVSELDKLNKAEYDLLNKQTQRIKELEMLIKNCYTDKLRGNISHEEYLDYSCEWKREKDILLAEIDESSKSNKMLYRNIDTLIEFCHKMPQIFANADIDTKQRFMRMLIEEITYDKDEGLAIRLKPIFEALRLVALDKSENVRTLKNPIDSDVCDFLASEISHWVQKSVRTLKTRIVTDKKDSEESFELNGAGGGIRTHAYRNHNPRS